MLIPMGIWGKRVVFEVHDVSPNPGRAGSDKQVVGIPGRVTAAQTEQELL